MSEPSTKSSKDNIQTKISICLQDEHQKLAIQKLAETYYVTSSELLRAVCILLLEGKMKFGETEIIKIVKNRK